MDKIPMTAEGYAALETELKHCQHFLFHREFKAAVRFRNGQPEQAHALHFRHDFDWNFVGVGNAFLVRYQAFTHKAPDIVQKEVEGFLVADHEVDRRP